MTTETLPTEPSAHVEAGAGTATGRLRLRSVALASVGELISTSDGSSEAAFLRNQGALVRRQFADWRDALDGMLMSPAPEDAALVGLGRSLGFTAIEVLAVALAAAVEEDLMTGRVLAHVQAPVGGARPTLGLLAAAWASLDPSDSTLNRVHNGRAVAAGILTVNGEASPAPERFLSVPLPLCLALSGIDASWAGGEVGLDAGRRVPLPPSTLDAAAAWARTLADSGTAGLVLRSSSRNEGRSAAAAVAGAMGYRPLYLHAEPESWVGVYAMLRGLLPVVTADLAPGERRLLPELRGRAGPVIAITGPDGSVESRRGPLVTWQLAVPDPVERAGLWRAAVGMGGGETGDPAVAALAAELARGHRHSAGRIAQLGQLARQYAVLDRRDQPMRRDVQMAGWSGEGGGLDTLAEPLKAAIPDGALIVSPELREQLELLLLRCRHRDALAEGLGPSASVRYRPGVRTLFTGPSGTGKTLAAGWMATRLSKPLYRVDLASVTSKYIGETEKNLARLLATAERDDVMLLFDEADSLFGKRTEIRDSNDRFANAQTNYLLQRIEAYEGIVVLTSNSKQRFDSAFARRLDCVVEFSMPTPEERRSLWQAHLGDGHALSAEELNRLSALADVPGGSIRNAVFTAALAARRDARRVGLAHCAAGLEAEFRKLGRQLPPELRPSRCAPGAVRPVESSGID